MSKHSSAAGGTALPAAQFETMLSQLEDGLRRIMNRTARTVTRLLLRYATDLAACSSIQLQMVRIRLAPFGVGFRLNDVIDKIMEVGRGTMTPIVAQQPGISCEKFLKLPPRVRQELNADKPQALSYRGKVKLLSPSQMTEREQQRLIRRYPTPKLLPPQEQDDPRPRPAPAYYRLTTWAFEQSTQTFICEFELGNSKFKGRIPFGDLLMMLQAAAGSLPTGT